MQGNGQGKRMGMTDAGREVVGPLVLGAWDAFLDLARAVDLDRPSRLPGWRVHEVCVHLGSWPDYRALAGLVASARAGTSEPPPDVDAANEFVTARHRGASRSDVLLALERHRQEVADYLDSPVALDRAATVSPVGRLPLLSVILGEAYELAVHGLDLAAAGAPEPPAHLLQAGLAALADVTGALTATSGIKAGAALHTPDGGWAFRSAAVGDRPAGGWTVDRLGPRRPSGAGVSGRADVLLDAASGRVNPMVQLARRRLALHDVPGLLRLAPVVEAAPGIPGGPVLQLAARSVSGAAGFLGRLRR